MREFLLVGIALLGSGLAACNSSGRDEKPAVLANAPVKSGEGAQQLKLLDSYTARISDKDKVDSSGKKLTDPRAMILQDRKNYYDLKLRDPVDTPSKLFASKPSRWQNGTPVSSNNFEPIDPSHPNKGYHWVMRQGVEYKISEGDADVSVRIYGNENSYNRVMDVSDLSNIPR